MTSGPVLICYDGSDGAREAIAVAAELLAGRRAVVLDVLPPPAVPESYQPGGPDPLELDRLAYEAALARAGEGARLAVDAGFAADARADLEAPTWRGVVETAGQVGASVIVIGSRGLTGFRELAEGTLSHDLAEHARRPVLVVPADERD